MRSLEAIVRDLRWSSARASATRYVLHAVVAASAIVSGCWSSDRASGA